MVYGRLQIWGQSTQVLDMYFLLVPPMYLHPITWIADRVRTASLSGAISASILRLFPHVTTQIDQSWLAFPRSVVAAKGTGVKLANSIHSAFQWTV